MTVSTTTSRVSYAGNGSTTAFSVPFYFLASADLVVIKTTSAGAQTTLVLNTDYTVTGAGVPAGGTVTCTVAPAASENLVIFRDPAVTQLTDYQANDPFPAETHERALDKLTMLAQRLKDLVGRSLTLSDGDTSTASTTLPSPSANKLIGWNTAANGLVNVDAASLLTIAGSSGFSTQTFSGTGAQTSFTLSAIPGAIANLEVFIGGVRQTPTTNYTVSGATLTFFVAPASGTNNILARWGTTLGIGVPSDTSVTTDKIADGAVTTIKIVDANVTAAKLATNAVTTAKIADANVTPAKLANSGYELGPRNKIINGKMDIAQRGTSFAAAVNSYTLDRWSYSVVGSTAAATITQQADTPSSNEFQNSLRVAVTTIDTSIAAGDLSCVQQIIEGFNARDLIGRTFTLSFWVRSSKTGIHCASFANSIGDRAYVSEYTINAANTWEYKSVTVAGGLITAGTWNWTNNIGLIVRFALAAGSTYQGTANSWVSTNAHATANQVNCLDTIGNIFAITGVQLEPGAVATPFEHRSYGAELALCQRYFENSSGNGGAYATTDRYVLITTATTSYPVTYFKVGKRATPTVTLFPASGTGATVSTGTGSFYQDNNHSANSTFGWTAAAEL